MKTIPNPWFVDRNSLRNSIEGGYRPMTIDSLIAGTTGSGTTLAAALFGNAAAFDFSRLIQTITSTHLSPSASPTVDSHDGVLGIVGRPLDAPLGSENSTPYLSNESTPDPVAAAPTPMQPILVAAVVSVGATPDLYTETPRPLVASLSAPLSAEQPTQQPGLGRIADLGFLQNLPATVWLSAPGFEPSETVLRTSDNAMIPVSDAAVDVIHDSSLVRPGLIYELTPALAADVTIPLGLLSDHNGAGGTLAADLFITDPAPMPDLGSVQFAAVLPDPIVDPGPLV